MGTQAVDSSHSSLTFGPVERVRVQVGFRDGPEDLAEQQFLLDVPVLEAVDERDPSAFERLVLSALEAVLDACADAPRHYSLHQHRSHTSWDSSPGVLEIRLLVTADDDTTESSSEAPLAGVTRAFRDLMELTGQPASTPTSRDAAILLARRGAATAYAADPDSLSLSAEEHHPGENSWTFKLRAAAEDAYVVVVGFVDGYAGSVSVRYEQLIEVSDSIGS